jgi:hypothetical protein
MREAEYKLRRYHVKYLGKGKDDGIYNFHTSSRFIIFIFVLAFRHKKTMMVIAQNRP